MVFICLTMLKYKHCNKCNTDKYVIDFYKHRSTCKECERIYVKQYRAKNPDVMKAINRRYNENNKDKVRLIRHEYRIRNIDHIKKQKKIYRNDHKQAISEHNKQYMIDNLDKVNTQRKRYRIENRDIIKTRRLLYHAKNTEDIRRRDRKRYADNPDHYKAYQKLYRSKHGEEIRVKYNIWKDTPSGKISSVRKSCKRRALGHNPINNRFNNSDYHHLRHKKDTGEIDNDIGLYIPHDLHSSIWHNGNNGQNMMNINIVALDWYLNNEPLETINPIAIDLYEHYIMLI